MARGKRKKREALQTDTRGLALAAAGGGGGTGAMASPLAHEGGAMLSFGPTFDVKGKR